jgi:hypothetical protein
MPKSLRYSEAIELEWEMARLLQKLSAFVDEEEDRIEDGAEDDPDYINALSDACILLDRACIQMSRVDG